MEARVLLIEDKVKKGEIDIASLSTFRYRQGPTIDARIILDEPQITLHCLDDEHRQAVFVEAPPGVDVSKEPFFFRAQYHHAQRLLTVPYETLHELAELMGDRFQRLIPMYSVARCGGTLMSRSFDRVNTVLSLDEPDVYNNIVLMRPGNGSRDAELTKLLRSCTRLLHKPADPAVDTLFLKFRPFSIEVGDLIYKAFPAAKPIFLYRNAETWARSAGRSIQSVLESMRESPSDRGPLTEFISRMDISRPASPVQEATTRSTPRHAAKAAPVDTQLTGRAVPLLLPYIKRTIKSQLTAPGFLKVALLTIGQRLPVVRDHCRTPLEYLQPYIRAIPPMKMLALLWLSPMHRYMAWHAQGIPMLAVQYETLVSAPLEALQHIFEYCGLPVEKAEVAVAAFAEDSQKNTPLSRDRVRAAERGDLAPELLAQLREILRDHPPTQTPDFVVPNSLVLGRARQTVR
jgi:hypothetical protein